ncbi:hypothetical protein CLOM_g23298, partial [Closterium sp. NIES-68]
LLLTRSKAQIVDVSLPGRKIYTECPRIEYSRQASDVAALISSKIAPLQVQASAGLRQRQGRRAPVLLLANSSFPMGASLRTPLARPDLVSLGLYHGLLYRLKVIVSVKNISDVMASAIRAHYDNDDPGLQVRLVEDSLVYLDASLRQLPCGTYAIVNLDHLMSSPSPPFVSQLARFLDLHGVREEQLRTALRRTRTVWARPRPPTIPRFNGEPVAAFFRRRRHLWPLLAGTQEDFFSAGSPADWPSGVPSRRDPWT